MRTEAHTWADGSLGQQDWTSPAGDLLPQAAETHQTRIGSIKHVTGRNLTMEHT